MSSVARQTLLTSAATLFYDHGISSTGIDAVVRHAGVTKPTLYAHFGSKSALVAAVLRRRHDVRRAELEALLDPLPRSEHPLAVFDWLGRFYTDDGERGCGFLNAAVELGDRDTEAREAVRAEKTWMRGVLVAGCVAAGCRDAETTGSQLLMLVDGVAGQALVGGRAAGVTAAGLAREAAVVLMSACR